MANQSTDERRYYRRQQSQSPHRVTMSFFQGARDFHMTGGRMTTVAGSVFSTDNPAHQPFVMNNHATNIDVNNENIRVNATNGVSDFVDMNNRVIRGMDVTIIGGNYYSGSSITRGNVHQDHQSGYTNTSFGVVSTIHLQNEDAATVDENGYETDSTLHSEEPPMPQVTYGEAGSQDERGGNAGSHDPGSTTSDESSRRNDMQYRNKPLPPIPRDITK